MSEIQKVFDENDEEYVIVAGGIKDGKITARPVVSVDPYPTLSQESLDFGESLRTAYDFSFMARLYRSGRAYVISGNVPENQIRSVEKSVPGLYDALWPDIVQQNARLRALRDRFIKRDNGRIPPPRIRQSRDSERRRNVLGSPSSRGEGILGRRRN